ncbi:hypothetical protein DPMN_008363 [Dreissena polymorpha]|uniref:Uncharacterized protein n=1 Tax=Dreissena polymorpha TaxID=45954 RepID=A0A9D4RZ29_DREPO|nr:hypothetical protein DPMN_008363 [Dreissena polymorpha]
MGREQRESGFTSVEDVLGGPGMVQNFEGVALWKCSGTAVLSTLNVLGKPSWGLGRRLVTTGVAIKAAQLALSRKSIFAKIINTPLAE